MSRTLLEQLHDDVVSCERCRRLRHYCAQVADRKRGSFCDWEYWGKPVPGFGDPRARVWIIGLAPAAHGANRTGRVFTGDRSGDFLFAALHRTGLANLPNSFSRDDGLKLTDCYISAAARCAPPGNKPSPQELRNCSQFLDTEWQLLRHKRVILALGKLAWDAALALARRQGVEQIRPAPAFAHAAAVSLSSSLWLLGSYHVSQQNTFTGRLTQGMFDDVLRQAMRLAGITRWRTRASISSRATRQRAVIPTVASAARDRSA
jgi:uracil-DNA glycosylase family 4